VAIALQSKIQSLKSIFRLIRLHPFDTSTEEGRSNERIRRAALTTLASVAMKIVTMISALISVPLTLHYLGAERYGLWMTISSFIACLSFADLGLGNGIINAISSSDGKDDIESAKRYISSGYLMLTGISLFLILVYFIVFPLVNWDRIFNVHTQLGKIEERSALTTFFFCFAGSISTSIIQRIQAGYQEGFNSNLWQLVGAILSLSTLVFFIYLHLGLPWLIFAFQGVPVLIAILNALVYFKISRPYLIPKISYWDRNIARNLLKTGFLFFVLQISVAIAYSSDNLVISNILGASAVPEYSVPARLFTVIGSIVGMMLTPLWPAYGEAWARGDYQWSKGILKKSLLVSGVITTFFSIIAVLFSHFLIHHWVGADFTVFTSIVIGLATWTIIASVGNAVAMFLNGVNVILPQVIISLVTAIVGLILKILFVHKFGVSGAVWGNVISFSLLCLLPYSIYIPNLLRKRNL
jgi:O-antigen/teichoic acid export membrane protein